MLKILGYLAFLAICISSIPATYFFFDKIVLTEMANHAPIQIIELLLGVVLVMTIALVMIGSQTLKVARTNPAVVLKNE